MVQKWKGRVCSRWGGITQLSGKVRASVLGRKVLSICWIQKEQWILTSQHVFCGCGKGVWLHPSGDQVGGASRVIHVPTNLQWLLHPLFVKQLQNNFTVNQLWNIRNVSIVNTEKINSYISKKQSCEYYCTEIGRVRHTVKKQVTGLSFTSGLVIRISHDEDPRSLKPSINSMSPSLVHFIGCMKGKRFMSNSSRELCIVFKNICNKETFPASDWISSSWLAFWSCPIFYIIRWHYNFYKVLHHVEKGGWSRFSIAV